MQNATAPTAAELNDVAIKKIIADAVFLLRDCDWEKHRAYEVAKAAICDFTLTADEYQHAIRELAKELGV